MKFIRFLGFFLFFVPTISFAASGTNFQNASQLLSAARRGDTQTVQILINRGTDVNYVDSTGLSLVCTAVMNNDTRAIQILQMYGADASNCDRQIKNYQQKSRVAARGEEYGFFSGLSSSHIIALSAVGVAAVIGGVALLTDAFDAKNDNGGTGSSGNRPSVNPGTDTTTSYTKLLAQNLPYGPACSGNSCPDDFTLWQDSADFTYMSDATTQNTFNYLMVARAYNAFVRGYLGMQTVRNDTTKEVFDLSAYPFNTVPAGGRPVNVAAITASGVNASGSAVDGIIEWFDDNSKNTLASLCQSSNGTFSEACQAAVNASVKSSHKYYNLTGTSGETPVENIAFDLSDETTVFGSATDEDTKLVKIIAGWKEGGRPTGDFYGFIPNGQLTVYKTGTNHTWTNPAAGIDVTGSYTMAGTALAPADTLVMFGGTELEVASVSGSNFVAISKTDGKIYHGYVQGNEIYIDSNANGVVNQIYTMGQENSLTLTKIMPDYLNYMAIYNALNLKDSGNYVANVVANLSLPDNSVNLGYATVGDASVLNNAAANETQRQTAYAGLINYYYNLDTTNDTTVNRPGTDAGLAFSSLLNNQQHILVNSAGRFLYGLGTGQSLSPQEATFENFAPVVYNKLQNLFVTVVAVKPENSTAGTSVSDYNMSGAGRLELSVWNDADDSSITYSSRMCGLAGTGNGGALNPWCFAAPGTTDIEATAAMAGAVALVKSAFAYMDPNQIFLLMALSADGPYLNATTLKEAGYDDINSFLQANYTLPPSLDSSDEEYLQSFKTAFGYGMINLKRATQPGTNVYFYSSDTNSIVSSNGKTAFWGNIAQSSTNPRASTVVSGRGTVRTAFYDVLESADGTLSLPRVWNMEFDLGKDVRHGLYMGDVLGEFAVDSTNKHSQTVGDMTFDMTMSPRAYVDNMNGLDNLNISFSNEKYDLDAGYQHYLTDGQSRFDGRANGVLGLVSNSVVSGARYKFGNFAFGARAFSGAISDENLLDNDPVVSSQFEPARLGLANGAMAEIAYNNEKFGFDVSFGNMHETNTVLGSISDGILALNGANTQYVDAVAKYRPFENANLFARATFATTRANVGDGIISSVSDIKSNAFALGADVGGLNFTASMPLAVVDGRMGYDYADLNVVESNGKYTVAINNPHVEYIDMVPEKREFRFSGAYKKSLGEFTDAGFGFIYRVNPGNTDAFGNESIFMFKLHHRLGI